MRNERKEARQFQNTYPHFYPGKKIKTVTFIVTHQCNLRCSYCYEGNKGDQKMSLDTAKKCVDLLFEEDARNSPLVNETEANGLIIEFIGGEPFLEIGLIRDTMSYFLSRALELRHRWAVRYMVNISTNGTLGEDERVKQFMRDYAGRLSIGVTIDGDKDAHDACRRDLAGNGSYDRAIKMFRETAGPDGKRTTKYTIAPGNLSLFASSVRHLVLEEGVDTLKRNRILFFFILGKWDQHSSGFKAPASPSRSAGQKIFGNGGIYKRGKYGRMACAQSGHLRKHVDALHEIYGCPAWK